MRLSQFIKESKDLTDFLLAVGFSFHSTEIEKNPKTKETTKTIKYVRTINDQEIFFELCLNTLLQKRKSLISAALFRNKDGGVIYFPLLMDRLGILRPTKTKLLKLGQYESRNDLKIELQQYKDLLTNQLKATLEGKEWTSVTYHPLDY